MESFITFLYHSSNKQPTRTNVVKNENAYKREELTCKVNIAEKTMIRMPHPWGNAVIRPLETKDQNKITGIRIRHKVRKIDFTSGPNMTRPPKKNFCNISSRSNVVKTGWKSLFRMA